MTNKTSSIGIFDSGFGGLTVMKAIRSALPQENLIYFGDTKNLPYGDKSAIVIRENSLRSLQFLHSCGVKLIIIACHTVCTTAYEELQALSPIPLIGMIEPSIHAVKTHHKKGGIVILGTSRTIKSHVYQTIFQKLPPFFEILSLSCPSFVPFIEEGKIDNPLLELAIQNELKPLQQQNIGTILLACTHFPLIQKTLQKILGPTPLILDPAAHCAIQTIEFLTHKNLLNDSTDSPSYTFYVSHNTEKFRSIGSLFLELPIEKVSLPTESAFLSL